MLSRFIGVPRGGVRGFKLINSLTYLLRYLFIYFTYLQAKHRH